MAIPVKSNIDLGQNAILNALLHPVSADPGTPLDGQVWYNTTTKVFKVRKNGATQVVADLSNSLSDFAVPSADVPWNSKKITGLADPTSAQDAATKAYVDASALGLDVHQSVRVASTATIDIAGGGLTNGVTIDGVVVATGDRVLLKDQSSGSQNGIYIVAASGAAARAADCNSTVNYVTGAFVFVELGTANGATGYIVVTQGAFTIGSTSITWTKFSGGGTTYTNGSGLSLTGATFAVKIDNVTIYVDGSGNIAVKSSATADQVLVSAGSGNGAWGQVNLASADAVKNELPIGRGGTGATTAAAARTALAVPTKFAADVGDNASTSLVVTHNLGTKDVLVQVHDNTTPYQVLEVEIQKTSTNTVTLVFAVAPTTNQYRCTVIG